MSIYKLENPLTYHLKVLGGKVVCLPQMCFAQKECPKINNAPRSSLPRCCASKFYHEPLVRERDRLTCIDGDLSICKWENPLTDHLKVLGGEVVCLPQRCVVQKECPENN